VAKTTFLPTAPLISAEILNFSRCISSQETLRCLPHSDRLANKIGGRIWECIDVVGGTED